MSSNKFVRVCVPAAAPAYDRLSRPLLDATVDQFYPILESIGDSIETIKKNYCASQRGKPSPAV
jgi:Mg2+ and Co2+ transporter CorA